MVLISLKKKLHKDALTYASKEKTCIEAFFVVKLMIQKAIFGLKVLDFDAYSKQGVAKPGIWRHLLMEDRNMSKHLCKLWMIQGPFQWFMSKSGWNINLLDKLEKFNAWFAMGPDSTGGHKTIELSLCRCYWFSLVEHIKYKSSWCKRLEGIWSLLLRPSKPFINLTGPTFSPHFPVALMEPLHFVNDCINVTAVKAAKKIYSVINDTWCLPS